MLYLHTTIYFFILVTNLYLKKHSLILQHFYDMEA